MVAELVDEIIDTALAEVEEPSAEERAGVRSGYVRDTLTGLLRKIGEKFPQGLPKELELCLRRTAVREPASSPLAFRNTPPRIGVLPLAANPIHWGHIIAALSAVDALELDVMVFLPAGCLDDAKAPAGRDIREQDRHAMVESAVGPFHPILQYSDVARGTNSPGECTVHALRALNAKTELDFNLVLRAANELRMRQMMARTLDCLQDKALLGRNSRHHLDLAFIDGLGDHAVLFDPERLWRYRQEIGLPLRCRLVTIDLPELAPFRSGNYRDSGEAAMVPRSVHRYAVDRHLYR